MSLTTSSFSLWRRLQNEDRLVEHIIRPGGLCVSVYDIRMPALSGKKLFFFSDLHGEHRKTRIQQAWDFRKPICFSSLECMGNDLADAIQEWKPDYLVFGGDLVSEAVFLEEAMTRLAVLSKGIPTLAVLGNWDRKLLRWIPARELRDLYQAAGVRLLVNQSMELPGIRFYGMDDFKSGHPYYRSLSHSDGGSKVVNCVISHNPDAIPNAMGMEALRETDLILCGHTHGGQVRFPIAGAVYASSRYGTRFAQGLLRCTEAKASMVVSAGVGTSGIPFRAACPPEVFVLRFTE